MRSNPLRKSSLWAFPPTLSAVSPLCEGGGQNGFSVRRKATFVWVFGSSFERRSRAADRWWNSWILLRVDDLFGSDRIQPPTGGQMQTDGDIKDFFPPTFCGVCVYMCVCVGVERSHVFSALWRSTFALGYGYWGSQKTWISFRNCTNTHVYPCKKKNHQPFLKY